MDDYYKFFDYDLANSSTEKLRAGIELVKHMHRRYGDLAESIERLTAELAKRESNNGYQQRMPPPIRWQQFGF